MGVFRSQYKITQPFGGNNHGIDYTKFGLKGHEGIDLVPTGSDWTIFSLTDGVVVNETDEPRSGAYGIWLTIWSPHLDLAFQYCHLERNYVSVGDKIKKGQKIGTMGKTGNATGAHLHLNVFQTDKNGIRLNRNNGYLGGIDPAPILLSLEKNQTFSQVSSDNCDPKIVYQSDAFIAVATKLQVAANKDVVLAEIDKMMTLEDSLLALQRDLQNTKEEAKKLKDEAQKLQEEVQKLTKENEQAIQDMKETGEQLVELKNKYDELTHKLEGLSHTKPISEYSAIELIARAIKKCFIK